MASRNVNPISGLDPTDKQSNTLKRQPNPDWSKNDLLRLLSYFEGELQARDITIAALRAEKAKNLLFQAKYGRFGLGDPFIALQRDSENMKDNSFDEPAIKSMYDNQLAQLENLIATQRKAQLKMREQLASGEKRYHKVVAELEDEKRKHAQDTAQGDDVTYMLEKERERLKQEVDFEKSTNKRLEKDLKKTLASLEEERANSSKHKQVAIMLIKERKRLMERVFSEKTKTCQFEQILGEEKDKVMNMAEGLVQESKKSLKMEAAMEKQLSEFDMEREQLKSKLAREENRNKELQESVDSLNLQVENLQRQMHSMMERTAARDTVQSIEIKSSVSPSSKGASPGASPLVVATPGTRSAQKVGKAGMDLRGNTSSPERDYSSRPDYGVRKPVAYSSPAVSTTSIERIDSRGEPRVAPVGASGVGDGSPVHRVNIPPGSSATVVTPAGGKISLHVAGGNSPRKVTPVGRGAPPPIPPNKPVLNPGLPGPKPAPPPKVGLNLSKDRVNASGAELGSGEHSSRIASSPKSVQIPVNVVGGQSVSPGSRTASRDSSPMRKTTQSIPAQAIQPTGVISPSSPALDFLGPEMADLQQLLATMTKGEASTSGPSSLTISAAPPTFQSSCHAPSPTCSLDIVRNSPVHRHAACGDVDSIKMLILDRDADVNLPMKDGTTPIHCAAEGGHLVCLKFLLDNGGNPNALRDDLLSPVHLSAANGHSECLEILLERGAIVNIGNQTNETPLHLAATRGHHYCCRQLLEKGARPFASNMCGLTPLHTAVIGSHVECLKLLLEHCIKRQKNTTDERSSLQHVLDMADKDGWTLLHMAACLDTEDSLRLLMESAAVDLDRKDRLGRSAYSVSSKQCREYLHTRTGSNNNNNHLICVMVELRIPRMLRDESAEDFHYVMGTVDVSPLMPWSSLEAKVCSLLESYYSTLDTGLRTRKIHRLEPESPTDNSGYTLGLGTSSIKHFNISCYQWSPGSVSEKLPFEILCNNNTSTLSITLNSSGDTSVSVAFDTLYPLATIRNYLRLLEQYKSVVFYGPPGSGKSYLAKRLAQCIAMSEGTCGRRANIISLSLSPGFSNTDFIAFLKQSGCIIPVSQEDAQSPILLLENMEKVNIAQLFGKLLDPVEYRGKAYQFKLQDESVGTSASYYLPDNFYLLGTMDRTRFTGLDLNIQQRFRWIHFRLDSEPFRNHLARYLHRHLLRLYDGQFPSPDNPVFRCAEWVICVWQRLNDSLGRLGLPELAFGPCLFFQCPLEKKSQEAVLQWVRTLWNETVAPQVCEAVRRGTGSDTSTDGQRKVANTALYVLMQRSIVLGCPLTGKEKEDYISGLSGSNELDIPLRVDKRRSLLSNSQKAGADNSKVKESRVEVISTSGVLLRNKNKQMETSFDTGLSNSKRRSLSESCVDKAARQEEEMLDSQPKVPKLEIRSPILLSLADSSTNQSDQIGPNTGVTSLTSVQRRHSSSPMASKKSRSSENISSTSVYNSFYAAKRRSASPFSFSLTTPTSSLNSFKFLQVSSPRNQASPTAESTSEPVTFTAKPKEKSNDIKRPTKLQLEKTSDRHGPDRGQTAVQI